MQNEQQSSENILERRIELSIPAADVEKEVETKLKRLAKTVKMPGFRPGKVPLKIVAQTHGPQARFEAIGHLVDKAFSEKVKEQKLEVAGRPNLTPRESEDKSQLVFDAVFEVFPEITIGDLTGQKIERSALEIGDADVNKTLEVLRKQHVSYTGTDRAAQKEDRLNLDFTGRLDGVEFEGGHAEKYSFILGSGMMLPDFEKNLEGMKPGETKTFDMTFPADYHEKNLAGKQVSFEISLHEVAEPKLPEVNSDFARLLDIADGDVEKLKEEIKNNLERETKNRIKARIKDQAMEALLAVTPVVAPKAMISLESRRLFEDTKRDMESYGYKANNMNYEESWFAERAERRVKLGLIVSELTKTHGLEVKSEQIRAFIDDIAQSYENPEELVRWYYAQPQRLDQIENVVLEDNVVDWVLKQAEVEEKAIAFDELMGNNPTPDGNAA